MTYTVKTNLKPTALHGIPDAQIAQHWKLYEGYVANVNALTEDLDILRTHGRGDTRRAACAETGYSRSVSVAVGPKTSPEPIKRSRTSWPCGTIWESRTRPRCGTYMVSALVPWRKKYVAGFTWTARAALATVASAAPSSPSKSFTCWRIGTASDSSGTSSLPLTSGTAGRAQ